MYFEQTDLALIRGLEAKIVQRIQVIRVESLPLTENSRGPVWLGEVTWKGAVGMATCAAFPDDETHREKRAEEALLLPSVASALMTKLKVPSLSLAMYLSTAKKHPKKEEGKGEADVNQWAVDLAGALCANLFETADDAAPEKENLDEVRVQEATGITSAEIVFEMDAATRHDDLLKSMRGTTAYATYKAHESAVANEDQRFGVGVYHNLRAQLG